MAANTTRFNLLLLEEGEVFFEDYAVSLYLPSTENTKSVSSRKQLSGRLKVASKNLIFEPHSISYPIIRFPFASMLSLHMDKSKQHLLVVTSQVVKMKKHNVVGPYLFEDISDPQRNGTFIFEPSYSRLDDSVQLIAKIYQITKSKDSSFSIKDRVMKLMSLREMKIPFDSSWFVSFDEIQRLNEPLIVSQLTPLIALRGQIQITNKRLYFQPFNSIQSNPMLKYNLKDMKYVYKRRHIMMNDTIEFIVKKPNKMMQTYNNNRTLSCGQLLNFHEYDSLLLSFNGSKKMRDDVFSLLLNENEFNVKQSLSLSYVMRQWIDGNVSNFDYLMFLNQLSGRSFNDLTQYPIMPWIITDYTSKTIDLSNNNIFRDLSKPVGALNPQRLQKILKRYKEMPSDNRFMYGSHYSTPGYVMYFLVRQFPEYQLRFQNGKFDASDRLFSSICRTWDSAYESLTDVKELIPQFYDGDGSFLLNKMNLNFGKRSDGKEVHNVELPPWANNSPKQFVQIMRKAMESDYVSQHLHNWIDLIFGYKQTGIEAERAFNVFYYLTYEGAVNIEAIKDKEELNSIQMQINEFGQTPSQLFEKPHPRKYTKGASTSLIKLNMDDCWFDFLFSFLKLSFIIAHTYTDDDDYGINTENNEHKNEKEEMKFENGNDNTSKWSYFQSGAYSLTSISPHSHRITDLSISSDDRYIFSTSHDSTLSVYSLVDDKVIRSTKISHLALSSCCSFHDKPFVVVGSWDNQIYVYHIEKNKVCQILRSHSDAISCLAQYEAGLLSGSWDNCVKVWHYKGNDGIYNKPILSYSIDSEVRSISSCRSQPNVFCCGDEDGSICLFDTRTKNKCIKEWHKAHKDETLSVLRLVKNWDASNGKLIKQVAARENLNVIQTDGNLLISGGESGIVRMFEVNGLDEMEVHPLKLSAAHSIAKIHVSKCSNYVIVGTKEYTNNVHIFRAKGSLIRNNRMHQKSKSLPVHRAPTIQEANAKTYSFGTSAFAKLTKSASSLFSFAQK